MAEGHLSGFPGKENAGTKKKRLSIKKLKSRRWARVFEMVIYLFICLFIYLFICLLSVYKIGKKRRCYKH